MPWYDILKLAVAIAALMVPILLGALRLWVAYEGDKRWAKRDALYDSDGNPKWATPETVADVAKAADAARGLVLAGQESRAQHHERIIRLEEADKNVMGPLRETLERINANMSEMGTRLARLEDIPRRLSAIEKRLDRRADGT